MNPVPPVPNTSSATAANVRRALSNDLLFMLGKVLRAISDALVFIVDRRHGSLTARHLISTVMFFIAALLRALYPGAAFFRRRDIGTSTFERALVAPPSRWAAP
ncbi:hypothetical protein [Sphingomonas corticis]|uniref:Uncharacterized protein n=1 Tax=Sphingomonas corticis TaxID=2722791 RepID=A0ABX1CPM1_9SPHN|nr:hypothetical protein [Sphingomonas corticis]NJR79903.1 hypothetical protein [Sphingomonas corticis]